MVNASISKYLLAFILLIVCFIPRIKSDQSNLELNSSQQNERNLGTIGLCQGVCFNDDDCTGNLKCFIRSGTKTVPGCSGSSVTNFFCYNPNYVYPANTPRKSPTGASPIVSSPTIKKPAVASPTWIKKPSVSTPTIKKPTVPTPVIRKPTVPAPTIKKTTITTPVAAVKAAPVAIPAPISRPPTTKAPQKPNGFRIKMYWEKGYFWQEERIEKFWCMECINGCKLGNQIHIMECDNDNTRFQFINDSSSAVQVKVADTNLCLELKGSSVIKLESCESNNSRQIFKSGRGNFNDGRFELHVSNGCLTQMHHPRCEEVVFNDNNCYLARYWDTSYWVKY